MAFLLLAPLPIVVTALMYFWFKRHAASPVFWTGAAMVAMIIGLVRVAITCGGWYAAERTSGWLQIPGYAATMFALPEVLLLPRSRHLMGASEYALLAALTFTGAAAWTLAVAAVARRSNGRGKRI